MDIDIEELLKEQIMEYDDLLDDLGIPKGVFQECWQSAINALPELDLDEVNENLESDKAGLMRLIEASPNVRTECISAICLGYGSLQDAIKIDANYPLQERIRDLIWAAMYRGIALTSTPPFQGAIQARVETFRRNNLSESGAKGALVRLQPFAELKSWALKNGENLGASKDVARRLERQLPTHLADISKDPRRLIYETLLNRNKPS